MQIINGMFIAALLLKPSVAEHAESSATSVSASVTSSMAGHIASASANLVGRGFLNDIAGGLFGEFVSGNLIKSEPCSTCQGQAPPTLIMLKVATPSVASYKRSAPDAEEVAAPRPAAAPASPASPSSDLDKRGPTHKQLKQQQKQQHRQQKQQKQAEHHVKHRIEHLRHELNGAQIKWEFWDSQKFRGNGEAWKRKAKVRAERLGREKAELCKELETLPGGIGKKEELTCGK